MATSNLEGAIATLSSSAPLYITSLTNPYPPTSPTRTSLSSNPSNPTPSDLHAELAHYKDLFAKLRFSYTEQVTKERLLKSVVADPPDLASPSEIAALEEKLAVEKAALKERKETVATILRELEGKAREVAKADVRQRGNVETLTSLPDAVTELEGRVEELRAEQGSRSEDARLNMNLAETREMVEARAAERELLNAKVREVQHALEARRRDVERLRAEMEDVEGRKRGAVREAVGMRERKGEGGMDAVEARGRWARATEALLTEIAV